MKYQINLVHGTRRDKSVTTIETLIDATNIGNAYKAYNADHASYTPTEEDIIASGVDLDTLRGANRAIILPYVASVNDGEAIMTLARQAIRDKRKFMRISGGTQERAEKELTPADVEDYTQEAATAIIATLTDDPNANMYDLRCKAFNAIDAYRYALNGKRGYNASVDYDPSLAFCNPFCNYNPRPTNTVVDEAIKAAMLDCGLSDTEQDILIIRANKIYTWDRIADITGHNVRSVKRIYNRACYKLLLWIINHDIDALTSVIPCPMYAYYTLQDLARQARIDDSPFADINDFIQTVQAV